MTAARPAPHAVVLNHAGYGQGNIHLPAFNPFDKLTDYNDPARVPGGACRVCLCQQGAAPAQECNSCT